MSKFSLDQADPVLADPNSRKVANVCPHCQRLLREAHQTDDGVRLCKKCLLEILRKPGGTCPNCSVSVEQGKYYPDRAAQREINQIIVLCPFKQLGCPWQDQLKLYEAHVASCSYAGVSCPNTGCPLLLPASSLDSHLLECEYRTVQCSYCSKEIVARDLETHHSTECESYPVICERCGEEVSERRQLSHHHLNECPREECLVCKKLVHRDTSKNVTDEKVTTVTTVTPQPKRTESLTGQGERDFDSRSSGVHSQTHTSTISTGKVMGDSPSTADHDIIESQYKSDELLQSSSLSDTAVSQEVVQLSRAGAGGQYHLGHPRDVFRHMQPLAREQGVLRTEFRMFKDSTESRLSELQTPVWGKEGGGGSLQEIITSIDEKMKSIAGELERERGRRMELEERLEEMKRDFRTAEEKAQQGERRVAKVEQAVDKNVQDIASVRQTAGRAGNLAYGAGVKGGGWEGVDGESGGRVETRVLQLEQRMEQQERQASTTKVLLSELELQLQASLASTHNGSFLWRIPEIARRRRDAIEERITSIYSPPFYTGRNGYKMCIRAYLNGDGIGYKTHLSVFFVMMKGEFDPLLKWPFDYKVSLILVDQEHRKHIVQTFKPTPDSSSFKKPQSDMNVASGCPQFAKLSVLDDENYTKGDVIYLKCIVDTSRIFHP